MNIFAAIKKAINSNLDKPLDITLNEIHQSVLQKNSPRRVVTSKIGVPYNSVRTSQVLSLADEPILSVKGSGRILQIIPVSNQSATASAMGTGLITVDNEIVLNGGVRYGTKNSNYSGNYILDYVDTHLRSGIYTNMFGDNAICYVSPTDAYLGDTSVFISQPYSVVEPQGVPFRNGFEIRLTQAVGETVNDFGVIAIYELYE